MQFSCGYLHVHYSSSTVWTGVFPPAVNDVAAVVGTGTCITSAQAASISVSAPTPSPTPFVAPSTIPATHITTFTYYTDATTCGTWAKYISYNYPKGTQQYAADVACGVKTIDYVSPSMPQKGEGALVISWGSVNAQQTPPPSPGPYYDVLAKDASGNLVKTYNGTGYLMDPHAADVGAYYQQTINDSLAYIAKYNPGVVPDLIFSDNADSIYGASANPRDYIGWNDWATFTAKAESALTGPNIILNTLGNTTAYVTPPAYDTISTILTPVKEPSIGGAMLENTYWGNKNATGYTDALGNPSSSWVAQEDMEITEIASGKFFNALANGTFSTYVKTNGPGSALGTGARMYVYASTLLSYDPTQYCGLPNPGCVLFGEEMSPISGVDAYPEQGFVALYPVQSAKTTINELRVGTSTLYERQFEGCYYQGSYVGPCAVVVNMSNSTTVAVSLAQYAHSMVLSGSDYLDGGTAAFNGPRVTQLTANSAAILLP